MKYRAEAVDRLGEIYELVFEANGEQEAITHVRRQGLQPEILLAPGDQIVWERSPHFFCKWMCDGAQTLDQVILRLKDFTDSLEEARNQGMELDGPVDNGHIFLRRPPGSF